MLEVGVVPWMGGGTMTTRWAEYSTRTLPSVYEKLAGAEVRGFTVKACATRVITARVSQPTQLCARSVPEDRTERRTW